jgi:hypothetical protein
MRDREPGQFRRRCDDQRIGAAAQKVHFHHPRTQGEAAVAGRHQEAGFLEALEVAIKRRPAVAELVHQLFGGPFEPLLGKEVEHGEHTLEAVGLGRGHGSGILQDPPLDNPVCPDPKPAAASPDLKPIKSHNKRFS